MLLTTTLTWSRAILLFALTFGSSITYQSQASSNYLSQASDAVVSFTLINANTDLDIGNVGNGDTINLALLGTNDLNIRANTNPSLVGSVQFDLDGITNYRTESAAPYALEGDQNGDYYEWTPSLGSHTLTATPYSSSGGNGTAGASYTVNFWVVDNPPVDCNGDPNGTAFIDDCGVCTGGNTGKTPNADKDNCGVCFGDSSTCVDCNGDLGGGAFYDDCGICAGGSTGLIPNAARDTCGVCFGDNTECAGCDHLEVVSFSLVDADNGNILGELKDGDTIDQTVLGNFSVRANVCDDPVGSVEFLLDGFSFNIDNGDPYSINGNSNGNYNSWGADSGVHVISAVPYSNSNTGGTQGTALTISVLVVDTGFVDTTAPGTFPNLVCDSFPGGRIALSFDGNLHDSDDYAAMPFALALFEAAGLGDSVVHVEYSTHLGFTDSSMEYEMQLSAYGGAHRFGYPSSIFHSAINDPDSTSDALADAINKSSATSPLWILVGGPMETTWRGLNKADSTKRKYVRVVSHSLWNEEHTHFGPPLANDWEDLVFDFSPDSVQFIQIADQNNSSNVVNFKGPKSYWRWLINSPDTNLHWLYGRNKTPAFDVSDAGMSYWLLSGGTEGGDTAAGPDESRALLESPCLLLCGCKCDTNSIPQSSITSPADSSIHAEGIDLVIDAGYNDIDSNIQKIEFYHETVLIGTDSVAPYSITWDSISRGDYRITTRSVDSCGADAFCDSIDIYIRPLDCAGIFEGSASLDECGICSGGTTGIIPNIDKDTCGVCFGDNYSCAPVDCHGDTAGTAYTDSCGVCSGGNTGMIPNESCTDCNGEINGTASLDTCGICSGGSTGLVPGASCSDCNGDPYGSAFIDSCGICAGGGTGLVPNADIDTCGVCFGDNFSCAPVDCNGDTAGTAQFDSCGICAGGNTGIIANESCTDCAGEINGTAVIDSCGVCSGGSTGLTPNLSCTDCNGDINGTAYVDSCNICAGGNTGEIPNASCTDCNGVINGNAFFDSCGVCAGGLTGVTPDESCTDCNGDINGTASLDDCGICSGGNTGMVPNSGKDCNGDCFGTAVIDSCGVCTGGNTANTFNSSCSDCNGDPNGTALIDDCGICSGGNTGMAPNAEKDTCGVCFGDNTSCDTICEPLEVVSLTLVHVGTAGDIGPLKDGDIINLNTIGSFGIRADVCDDAVGSVEFILNGSRFQVENIDPYSLTGDSPRYSYNSWNPDTGSYTLTAIPYSGGYSGGAAGISKTVNFQVVDGPPTDCNGDTNGTASIDACGICSGGNTGLAPNASCTDCNGVVNGTAFVDSCGQCAAGNTGVTPNSACIDCNGDINGTASIDDCGICTGGNTGLVPNASCEDCNGDPNGSASLDDCGVCTGGNTGISPNSTCNFDCYGDLNGSAFIDSCGICAGGNTGVVPNVSCTDCNGEINGTASFDSCGICSGGSTGVSPNSTCTFDCNGDIDGTAFIDSCGQCAGGNTGVVPNASCTDCNEDINGSASIDLCGICSGGNTGITPNESCTDCNGDINGLASIDSCNVCSGGNTGIVPGESCATCVPLEVVSLTLMQAGNGGPIRQLVDGDVIYKSIVGPFSVRADVCDDPVGSVVFNVNGSNVQTEGILPYAINGDNGGSFNSWNPPAGTYTIMATPYSNGGGSGNSGIYEVVTITIEDDPPATDCNGDPNGTATIDNCGACTGGNTGIVPNSTCDLDCNGDVNGTAYIDNCGICAGGNTGVDPDVSCADCHGEPNGTASIDNCGVCSGGSTGLIPDASCSDCNGDPNGLAFVDTCGVCAGGSTGIVPNQSCAGCEDNEVVDLVLVNATTDLDVKSLVNGDTIDKSVLPYFSVRAEVCNSNAVESVVFNLNGNDFRTENVPIYGTNDVNSGDYTAWDPGLGSHVLTATPYSGNNLTGTAGVAKSVSFFVTEGNSDIDCDGVENGSAFIDSCGVCAGGTTGIIPNTNCTDCNGEINGTASVDNCGICSGGSTGLIPDATCDDCNGEPNGSAFIDTCGICAGGNTGVTPNTSCGGPCQDNEVVALVLINANTGADIGNMTNGDTIDKSLLPAFSVRAEVCTPSATESVKFDLNGNIIQTENIPPYSINGDNSGNYTPWDPGIGSHNLTAIPFAGNNGSGAIGISLSVSFWVIDGVAGIDCNGDPGGSAYIDGCGECVGGNTGKTPCATAAGCDQFIESNGLVVVEVESEPKANNNWYEGTGPVRGLNIQNPSGSYYMWQVNCISGTDPNYNYSNCGGTTGGSNSNAMSYEVYISTPGRYRFQMRSWQPGIQTGSHAASTENNDFWLQLPDGGGIRKKGSTEDPIGSSEWVKVYQNNTSQWVWASSTVDNNPHQIFVDFPSTGSYTVKIGARSKLMGLDRFVLYRSDNPSNNNSESSATTAMPPESARGSCASITNGSGGVDDTQMEELSDARKTGLKLSGTVDNSFEQPEIKVYPNPTTGELNLEVLAEVSAADIFIYNATGKLIFKLEKAGDHQLIDLSAYATGLYWLKIKIGETYHSRKIYKH